MGKLLKSEQLALVLEKSHYARTAQDLFFKTAEAKDQLEAIRTIANNETEISAMQEIIELESLIEPIHNLDSALDYVRRYGEDIQDLIVTMTQANRFEWNGMFSSLVWIIYREVAKDILRILEEK